MPCYVLGCKDLPILSTTHRHFGIVTTCGDHNPARHAYDLPQVPSMAPGAGPRSGPAPSAPVPVVPPPAPIAPPALPPPIEAYRAERQRQIDNARANASKLMEMF